MSRLGRVVIYSIAGCPHCLAAKTRLKAESLQYTEVRVDRFPASVREWLQHTTGKTSVPQIFFNSTHVGGNKELQEALNATEAREELFKILNQEPVTEDQPLLPNPGDAIDDEDEEDISIEEDKYFGLVEKLTVHNLVGSNYTSFSSRLTCSPVKNSISGENLLKFIGDAGEKKPDEVAKHLLESRFLRKVSDHGEKAAFTPEALYVVAGLEAQSEAGCLNTMVMSSSVLASPDLLAQQIRNILLKLFSSFLSEDGSAVDYAGIAKSRLFEQLKLLSVELQRADIDIMNENEKIAFFINIYNALVIHAHVERGVPSSTYARYKFFSSMSYNIGGYVWTLNEIENGILRSNRASMATLYMKPLSSSDPKIKIILPQVEPRIHFALNCGAKSCPPIKTFAGSEVMDQLDVATGAFLENDDALWISEDRTEVRLTQLFQWYQVDFGASMKEVLAWILAHVTLEEKKTALGELISKNQYKVSYTPYDWGHNNKD